MRKIVSFFLMLFLLCFAASSVAETLTISMVGDCTIGEQYRYRGYKSGYVYRIVNELGMDYPFSASADLFAQDDLTIANCECALTNGKPLYPDKIMSLYGPPEFAQIFVSGNVDVCSISNNHAMDFGYDGRADTIAALDKAGIGSFGEEKVYSCEVKGVKIGFVAHTFPITDQKMEEYRTQIQQLRDEGCTFIVASIHWGKEENYNLNSQQLNNGSRLIDYGADLVYGHGPHVLQPIEYYKGHLIFYSTANFTFGANAGPKDDDTAVFQVTYEINEDGTLTPSLLTAIPYKMHYKKDFRPYPVEDEAAKLKIWNKLWRERKPFSNLPASFKTTGVVDFSQWTPAPIE